MESADKDTAAFSWFAGAWDDYVGALPLIAAVTAVLAAVSAGSFLIVSKTSSFLPALPYMLLVMTPFTVGANLVYVRIARGGAGFADLFSAFPVYHRVLAVSIWLGAATLGGVLLLVIPGVIIHLTYMFSEYTVVDKRTGVKDSFLLSAAMTYGWRTRLLPLLMLAIGINFLVPDIYIITGTFKAPVASLDLRPWNVTAAVLKTFVFLPWLNLVLARAYVFLLSAPPLTPQELPADD